MNYFLAQYITETPPPIRTNTDLAILFNTDHHSSLERYAEDFSGKMNKRDFINFFKNMVSEPHTFLAIDNDPNCDPRRRYYVGKAEVLDAKIDYIMGCEAYWEDSVKQLGDIISGKMARKLELTKELAEHHPLEKPKKVNKTENVQNLKYPEKSKLRRNNFIPIENHNNE